jgi:hypothetical protein
MPLNSESKRRFPPEENLITAESLSGQSFREARGKAGLKSKTMMKVLARRLPLIFLLIFPAVYCYCVEQTDFEKFIRWTEKALDLKQELYNTVWQGFDLNDFPIGFFDSREAYLINHASPGTQFQDTGRKVCGAPLYHAEKKPDVFLTNTVLEFNGCSTPIFLVRNDLTEAQFYSLLFHEVFHAFQKGSENLNDRYGDVKIQPFFPLDNSTYYTMAYLEQLLLRDAFCSLKPKTAARKMHQYLAVFQSRTALLDKAFRDFEYEEQINEGTATYVGLRGASLLGYSGYAHNALLNLLEGRTTAPAQFKQRCYGTGAALCFLLDRYSPEWREKLGFGLNLVDIMALRFRDQPLPSLDGVCQTYNCGNLRRAMEELLDNESAERKKMKEAFLQEPYLEIVFPSRQFLDAASMRFDPLDMVLIDRNLLCHKGNLILSSGENFQLRSQEWPIFCRLQPGNIFFISSVLLKMPEDAHLETSGGPESNFPDKGRFLSLHLFSKNIDIRILDAEILKQNGFHILKVQARKSKSRF